MKNYLKSVVKKNCEYYYQASMNSRSGKPSHINTNTRYFVLWASLWRKKLQKLSKPITLLWFYCMTLNCKFDTVLCSILVDVSNKAQARLTRLLWKQMRVCTMLPTQQHTIEFPGCFQVKRAKMYQSKDVPKMYWILSVEWMP